MLPSLARMVLIAAFARGAHRPAKQLALRSLLGLGAAVVFGSMFGSAITRMHIPNDLALALLIVIMMLAGFFSSGLVLLTMIAMKHDVRSDKLICILRTLPLCKNLRWFLGHLPTVVVITYLGVFGTFLIVAASRTVGYWPGLAVIAFWLGLYSAYGFLLLPVLNRVLVRVAAFFGMIFLLMKALDWWLQNSTHVVGQHVPVAICCAVLLANLGYWFDWCSTGTKSKSMASSVVYLKISKTIPQQLWFSARLARNERTRNSLLTAVLLSSLFAAGFWVRSSSQVSQSLVMLLGSILSATFACDVRGVVTRYKPAEQSILWSINALLKQEGLITLLASAVIGLPLTILWLANDPSFFSIVAVISSHLAGGVIGLLVGTVLVPAAGEMGTQFLSGVTASGLVVAYPRVMSLHEAGPALQIAGWLSVSVTALVLIYGIEKTRRKRYGYA